MSADMNGQSYEECVVKVTNLARTRIVIELTENGAFRISGIRTKPLKLMVPPINPVSSATRPPCGPTGDITSLSPTATSTPTGSDHFPHPSTSARTPHHVQPTHPRRGERSKSQLRQHSPGEYLHSPAASVAGCQTRRSRLVACNGAIAGVMKSESSDARSENPPA